MYGNANRLRGAMGNLFLDFKLQEKHIKFYQNLQQTIEITSINYFGSITYYNDTLILCSQAETNVVGSRLGTQKTAITTVRHREV